jgi:hypothetical protein
MLTVLDEFPPAPPAADAHPRTPMQLRLQAEGLFFPDRPPDVRWAAAAEGEAVKIQHEAAAAPEQARSGSSLSSRCVSGRNGSNGPAAELHVRRCTSHRVASSSSVRPRPAPACPPPSSPGASRRRRRDGRYDADPRDQPLWWMEHFL